jgi:cysteine desulfurase family protein
MIYLDNAATSWPKPEIVYQTMDRFMREKGGNPGHGSHSLAMAAKQVVDEARTLTARLIEAPEIERLVFTLNCTDSINLALKGLLKPGDHVITSTLEHNAMVRPLRKLETLGVKVTWLKPSAQSGAVAVEDIAGAINASTKLIAMIHASNVNGAIQPIADYGGVARKHNLLFLVDAAQTAGHFPLNVAADKVDLLAFSGHKGPLGPPGVGVLYIGPRVALDTIREGGTGIASESETQPDILPNKFESGTVNSPGIAGLGAGLKFLREMTLPEVALHEGKLVLRLIEGLASIPGVSIFHAPNKTKQAPVISFNLKGYEPGEAGAILDQAFDIKVRSGLHCSPAAHKSLGTFPRGTLRISPGIFNTQDEIDQTLSAISILSRSPRAG